MRNISLVETLHPFALIGYHRPLTRVSPPKKKNIPYLRKSKIEENLLFYLIFNEDICLSIKLHKNLIQTFRNRVENYLALIF